MSEELAGAGSGGKLAKAAGRFLVGDNQYALIAVTCHVRAAHSATEDDIEQLGEQYLTVASTYALGLGRALAERGTPPTQLEVDAECVLDRVAGEARLSDLALDVRGQVPGCDQHTFEATAADAARVLTSSIGSTGLAGPAGRDHRTSARLGGRPPARTASAARERRPVPHLRFSPASGSVRVRGQGPAEPPRWLYFAWILLCRHPPHESERRRL